MITREQHGVPAGRSRGPDGGIAACDMSTFRCTTCGDMAIEGRVVRLLDDDLAVVATAAGTRVMSVALVDATEGDVLLFHADEAIGTAR